MKNHAGIEGDDLLLRNKQRVDVDLLDPALFRDELAEADQQIVERLEFDGRPAAHSLECTEDSRLLDNPARERGVERRQTERAIFEHLDELAARAEKQHRAELRIDRAAEDQLVSIAENHRLDGDAERNRSPCKKTTTPPRCRG